VVCLWHFSGSMKIPGTGNSSTDKNVKCAQAPLDVVLLLLIWLSFAFLYDLRLGWYFENGRLELKLHGA
jgi:hypothetical protein